MNSVLETVQAVEGVRKVRRGEGERFDIADVHLTWKVKARDSAYSFSVMEATLAPGEGVPVHSHPSAESFYVLSYAVFCLKKNDTKHHNRRWHDDEIHID